MVSANEIRSKYLKFFESRGHKVIPSAPLVPENDPTVLFTTAGMHPLVPYLLGQPHPLGKRLVDYQKCLRTDDIDEVGDTFHHTFFEMLGNWSLGDYFKKEAITWSYEFLTQELKIDPNRLFISCFAGDADAPKDEESAQIWESLGIPRDKIYFFGKKDNWWGPAGLTGPCGPDTEMYYDTTQKSHGPDCQPGDDCGRFCEIWNNVFMEYNKTAEGKFVKLSQPNVDTGMGLERISAVLNGFEDNYLTDLWQPVIGLIEKISNKKYNENKKAFRIIADHLRAAAFIISDGVQPANKERGYVLRRLIRSVVYQVNSIKAESRTLIEEVSKVVVSHMSQWYPELIKNQENILNTIGEEISKLDESLKKGISNLEKRTEIQISKHPLNNDNEVKKIIEENIPYVISGDEYLRKYELQFGKYTSLPSIAAGTIAFVGLASYGIRPGSFTPIVQQKIHNIDPSELQNSISLATQLHQDHSRTTSGGMFKGGLADKSDTVVKYHTATHLLHQALRDVLGSHVQQKGSHITHQRLRFDFSHPTKLTVDKIQKIEDLINQKIAADLPVKRVEMPKKQALSAGALAFFPEKYPETASVYLIGDYSKELCGGPHVDSTSKIGRIKITREESAGSGIRRIYAALV